MVYVLPLYLAFGRVEGLFEFLVNRKEIPPPRIPLLAVLSCLQSSPSGTLFCHVFTQLFYLVVHKLHHIACVKLYQIVYKYDMFCCKPLLLAYVTHVGDTTTTL